MLVLLSRSSVTEPWTEELVDDNESFVVDYAGTLILDFNLAICIYQDGKLKLFFDPIISRPICLN